MVREQFATQPVTKPCTDERADHVEGAAAEQEHEGGAGTGRSESGKQRGIQRLTAFDHVESFMSLTHGDAGLIACVPAGVREMLRILLRRLVRTFFDTIASLLTPFANGAGRRCALRFPVGCRSAGCRGSGDSSRIIGAILRLFDIMQMQRPGHRFAFLGVGTDLLKHIEYRIILLGSLFGLLLRSQLFGQVGGDL